MVVASQNQQGRKAESGRSHCMARNDFFFVEEFTVFFAFENNEWRKSKNVSHCFPIITIKWQSVKQKTGKFLCCFNDYLKGCGRVQQIRLQLQIRKQPVRQTPTSLISFVELTKELICRKRTWFWSEIFRLECSALQSICSK